MTSLISDPWFYAAAIPAVLLVGLSKGGLGGGAGFIGVPMMALAISPIQAAAILLPILIVMDIVSLWSWQGVRDNRTLLYMLPGGMVGIAIGWFTASIVTADIVKLILGAITIVFVGRWLLQRAAGRDRAAPHNVALGSFWGLVSGFTSFVAHAGGPPYQVYTLRLKQDPKVFTGTSAIYFAVTNFVKLLPYFALGQFDGTNLTASLILMPIAPAATFVGAWVVKRMRPEVFYPVTYATVFVVALKLFWDGLASVL